MRSCQRTLRFEGQLLQVERAAAEVLHNLAVRHLAEDKTRVGADRAMAHPMALQETLDEKRQPAQGPFRDPGGGECGFGGHRHTQLYGERSDDLDQRALRVSRKCHGRESSGIHQIVDEGVEVSLRQRVDVSTPWSGHGMGQGRGRRRWPAARAP
jgi:hypothetical protein